MVSKRRSKVTKVNPETIKVNLEEEPQEITENKSGILSDPDFLQLIEAFRSKKRKKND